MFRLYKIIVMVRNIPRHEYSYPNQGLNNNDRDDILSILSLFFNYYKGVLNVLKKEKKALEYSVAFIIILVLAVICATAMALAYKGDYAKSQKRVEALEKSKQSALEQYNDESLKFIGKIKDKDAKIKSLMEEVAELSSYKKRVEKLEDDAERLDASNMRINVNRIQCPLNIEELKLFDKLLANAYQAGGNRKVLENIMKVQDKVEEIIKSEREFLGASNRLKNEKKMMLPDNDKDNKSAKKHVIGRVDSK